MENAKKTFLDEDYNRESSGFAEVQIGCSALAGGLNSRPIPLFFEVTLSQGAFRC